MLLIGNLPVDSSAASGSLPTQHAAEALHLQLTFLQLTLLSRCQPTLRLQLALFGLSRLTVGRLIISRLTLLRLHFLWLTLRLWLPLLATLSELSLTLRRWLLLPILQGLPFLAICLLFCRGLHIFCCSRIATCHVFPLVTLTESLTGKPFSARELNQRHGFGVKNTDQCIIALASVTTCDRYAENLVSVRLNRVNGRAIDCLKER